MKRSAAEVICEYGPFPGINHIHGLTFDGRHVWFASGDKVNALDPETGKIARSINVMAYAGTAFDGEHLFQIAEDRIQKIDPKTGRVLGLLFGHPARSYYATELITLAGAGSGAVQRELARLVGSGLVTVRPIGNQKHYQADPESPFFHELCAIAQKTMGFAEPREAHAKTPRA